MNVNRPIEQSFVEREKIQYELMNQLIMMEKCRDIKRMESEPFLNLCEILKKDGGLQPTRIATVEEQFAKFLHILSHNVKNRTISFFFRRSGETTSRHFHNVLKSIILLEEQFLRQPDGIEVPGEILNNNRFYPYFKVKINNFTSI